jgi:hypothetical protein
MCVWSAAAERLTPGSRRVAEWRREVVAQRRGELQREMESRMHEVQQQAGADLQAALDELEKEETAKGHAALADVRKDAAARLEADMAALEAEMTDRRGAVLQSVEQECQDQMKLETDKMHRFFAGVCPVLVLLVCLRTLLLRFPLLCCGSRVLAHDGGTWLPSGR